MLSTDAGKLMLKESEPLVSTAAATGASTGASTGAGTGASTGAATGAGTGTVTSAGAGVVLRGTPVSSPPRGARVFTVGQRASRVHKVSDPLHCYH